MIKFSNFTAKQLSTLGLYTVYYRPLFVDNTKIFLKRKPNVLLEPRTHELSTSLLFPFISKKKIESKMESGSYNLDVSKMESGVISKWVVKKRVVLSYLYYTLE